MRYWTRTDLPAAEVRRRAMLYFGREATPEMGLVAREPARLLFSDPGGDLVVEVAPGQPGTVGVITTHWHAEAQEFLGRMVDALDGVLHYESQSEQPAQEIVRRAREYFGPGPEGMGLTLSAEGPHALEFTDGGGRVVVAVEVDGLPTVRVTARGWTYQAEQFLRLVSRER